MKNQYSSKIHEQLKTFIYRRDVDNFKTLWNEIIQEAEPRVRIAYLEGKHDEGRGLLGWAANRKGNKKMVEEILQIERDGINRPDGKGRTPLSNAVSCDDAETVKLLLQHRADPSIADFLNKSTCFHVAAHGASKEVIKLLLESRANLMAEDSSGATPIHIAAKYSVTALHHLIVLNRNFLSIRSGNLDLLKGIIDKRDNDRNTPLHWAAESENEEAPTYLLLLGASRTVKNKDGQTPYQAAESWEYNGKSGRAIQNFKDKDMGLSRAMEYAKQVLAYEAAEELEAAKEPTVKIRLVGDEKTETSCSSQLFKAVNNDDIDNVLLLIKHKADPNVPDELGNTCLHVAARVGANNKIIELLLSAGADLLSKNELGQTPIHIAAKYSFTALYYIVQSILEDNPGSISSVIKLKDGYGNTPLHWAAKSENEEASTYLLMLGASRTVKNEDGQTPYQTAESWESNGRSSEAILNFRGKRGDFAKAQEYAEKVLTAQELEAQELATLEQEKDLGFLPPPSLPLPQDLAALEYEVKGLGLPSFFPQDLESE